MYTVCVIGAGQLGSRHLQGILKSKLNLSVYVVDPVQVSLETAKLRGLEVTHTHSLNFCNAPTELPKHLDVVIVATNSNVREQIVTDLVQKHSVNYLILEKVLFQDIGAYQRVQDLFSGVDLRVYVNHPRRMFGSYVRFKEMIKEIGPVSIQVTGGEWGLACNSLHFLDLFEYIFQCQITTIETRYLNQESKSSKRAGFIEYNGTIVGALANGSTFQITSFEGVSSPIILTISGNQKRFLIQEGVSPGIYEVPIDVNNEPVVYPFQFEYQSNMTTTVIDSLISRGSCELTEYSEASTLHIKFMSELLNVYNKNTGLDSTILPIT